MLFPLAFTLPYNDTRCLIATCTLSLPFTRARARNFRERSRATWAKKIDKDVGSYIYGGCSLMYSTLGEGEREKLVLWHVALDDTCSRGIWTLEVGTGVFWRNLYSEIKIWETWTVRLLDFCRREELMMTTIDHGFFSSHFKLQALEFQKKVQKSFLPFIIKLEISRSILKSQESKYKLKTI